MEVSIYRQKATELKNGKFVHAGEDAQPYVDDHCLIIADGLGGKGALLHSKIVEEMFEEDKILDVLFKEVFEEYDDERLIDYVKRSFEDLFNLKEYYKGSGAYWKTSSYFGSRIVSAVLLHEMLYSEELKPDVLFERYRAAEEDQKEQFLATLGDQIANMLKEKLGRISERANIIYESSVVRRLVLLATTLCATVFRETEEGVEAIYFTAGDSRPYVWTEAEGMCQLLEDQERADGGMTNFIGVGQDFSIRCNYFRFQKPCILFNATDGCFDMAKYCQIETELKILEALAGQTSKEGIEEQLVSAFASGLDDSSTLAMKTFGYTDEEVREGASRRLVALQTEYLAEFPDLLEHDYRKEYQAKGALLSEKLAGLKEEFKGHKAVMDHCAGRMKTEQYPPYRKKVEEFQGKCQEVQKEIDEASDTIKEIISRNYTRFLPLVEDESGDRRGYMENRKIEKIEKTAERMAEKEGDYKEQLQSLGARLNSSVQEIKTILGTLMEIGVPKSYSDYDDIAKEVIEGCETSLGDLFDFVNRLKSKKEPGLNALEDLKEKYIKENRKLAAQNSEKVQEIHNKLITQKPDPELPRVCAIVGDHEALQEALQSLKDGEEMLANLDEDREVALDAMPDKYWDEKYVEIIKEVIEDESVDLPPQLRDRARDVIKESERDGAEVKQKAEMQERLFEKYEAGHDHFFRKEHGEGEQ